jgi:hypothetical protein
MKDFKKTVFSIIALSMIFSFSLFAEENKDWAKEVCEEGSIEFKMPMVPKYSKLNYAGENGQNYIFIFTHDGAKYGDINNEYRLSFSDANSFIIKQKAIAIDTLYQRVVDKLNERIMGDVISWKEFQAVGYSGREYKISTYGGKAIVTARIVVRNGKIYMFRVMVKKEDDGNDSQLKFFNSIKFLD